MAANAVQFKPKRNHFAAFLSHVYKLKFDTNVIVFVVLLFAVFATVRTQHYISYTTTVAEWVAWSLAISIETTMIASGAACFMALRDYFYRELKNEDADIAKWGVYFSFAVFVGSFITLLFVAGADAALESGNDWAAMLIQIGLQFAQGCFVGVFLVSAYLEERDSLREEFELFTLEQERKQKEKERVELEQKRKEEEEEKRRLQKLAEEELAQQQKEAEIKAGTCQYCDRFVGIKNIKKHERGCTSNPNRAEVQQRKTQRFVCAKCECEMTSQDWAVSSRKAMLDKFGGNFCKSCRNQ